MTREELEQALKSLGAKNDKEGFWNVPENTTYTVYVSHDGGTLTVTRVEAVRGEGELVLARTSKKELFALVRSDVYALATEGQSGSSAARRPAGFG
jgi:hypothetical protein